MIRVPARLPRLLRRLRRDTSGLALLEFALGLPILLAMGLTGAELTNYITTRMRVSQLALQLADDAARMGEGTQITAKSISETDINDLFAGAQLQSGNLDLKTNGRVILTEIEPQTKPVNTTPAKYIIGWKRCYGAKTTYVPLYPPTTATTDLAGIGPVGAQVGAQDDNSTMFVEVYYVYKPIFKLGYLQQGMIEIASMSVRDRRDLTLPIPNTEGAKPASC